MWSYTTGGGVFASPAIANGVVYIGSEDGNVYAFHTSAPTQYTLTMKTVGQGSVLPGNGTQNAGATVNLQAMPAAGWSFGGWSGDASGSTNTSITIDGDKIVTATFTQIPTYTVTLHRQVYPQAQTGQ